MQIKKTGPRKLVWLKDFFEFLFLVLIKKFFFFNKKSRLLKHQIQIYNSFSEN